LYEELNVVLHYKGFDERHSLIARVIGNIFPAHAMPGISMTKSVDIIILNRFEPLHRLICPYEILIGLPSNLIRFSALRVGTLINNRLIARLAAT